TLFLERPVHLLILLIRHKLGLGVLLLVLGLLRLGLWLRLRLRLGLATVRVVAVQLLGQISPLRGVGICRGRLGCGFDCHAALCCCLGCGLGIIAIIARCSAVC